MKQYKAVPGPTAMEIGHKDSIQKAFNDYSDIINREATDGWEYHSMDTITVNKKGGCLRKDSVYYYQILIFQKEV